MSNLHHSSVVAPDKQIDFNQWVKELKVSSGYAEDKILQMVLRDEDRRLQSEDYLQKKMNPAQPGHRISLAKLLKAFKEKYGTSK